MQLYIYFKTMDTTNSHINPAVLDELRVMLTRCRPTLNGFWQNQKEAAVNACLVLMIECVKWNVWFTSSWHNGALYWYFLQTCYGIMTSTVGTHANRHWTLDMYVQLSSLILVGSIIIVHDLWSSFESMKNVSDLTVLHNQCKPCGGGGARQGVGIWPWSKYCGQISKVGD